MATNNPYLQPAIDAAQGDIVRNYNLSTQPAYNSAMVRSGSFGNSGVQQLNENAQLNLQKSLGDVSSNMRNNDYQFNNQFNRSLFNDAYSQNQQNLQTGIGLLDRMQAYDSTATGNATTQQNTPLNYWQQFSQGANSIGQGYGTSTGSQAGGGSNPWVSALGGAQLGSSVAKGMGWGGGWSPSTSSGSSDWASGSGSYSGYNQPDYGGYF
ncbi:MULTISPECIES: hypothetical protein [unclassified Polaromonas]|jgi:hypothetical protein|uniref:hypothetical protein n=1 Tax=unclassified Polaromonas TaxID=2638319 RepID=UPI000BCBF370|nr:MULTISPECIES: hypothetical protein [unclassified Polaromonas]OYY34787.1 MAG: hypothetical protein B7Y60_15220 [Polaromonas sp. 35-63-35]OYZ19326.1 MAG: hypothetical protein B7Y28_12370 [Polaromonas sp. 16-63-31]OYZ77548.1 MAG: hypothetical protein B7Y09_16380 [Polaromonas sp. 24-63-21]OZA48469.1 MAG: hypothetical protein B7X88_18140 [Polaromonas sp. 17-63-33]OZA87217.1 MAG: hypothetical protein B7X65_13610 [Polaromonas sp. 39-63-25]